MTLELKEEKLGGIKQIYLLLPKVLVRLYEVHSFYAPLPSLSQTDISVI